MVKINIKYEDRTEFWLETQTGLQISNLTQQVNIVLKNKRLLAELVSSARALGEETKQGAVDEEKNEGLEVLNKTLAEIKARFLDSESITAEEPVKIERLSECFSMLQGGLRIAFKDLDGDARSLHDRATFSPDCSADEQQLLWFSSRQLEPDRQLSSYVGTNEKSKVILRLSAPGSVGGPPPLSQPNPTLQEYVDKVQKHAVVLSRTEVDRDMEVDVLRRQFQGLRKDITWK